jgi:glycine C-acetyltransferase/8-amino-7-oxononanoate synthase
MANESFIQYLSEQLLILEQSGRHRRLRVIDSPAENRVVIDHKPYLAFCSNNYLGLANDPRLKQAAVEAIHEYGWGSGASRLICGTLRPHKLLEEELAQFKAAPAAIVFPTGYMANLGVISAVVGRQDTVIIDRLCHASIVDGCRLSQAKLQVYPHCDLAALEKVLKRSQNYSKRLIITDSVFSMDGDLAPLPQMLELAHRYAAILMVDEAHATGVLGEHGRGALEHFQLEGEVDIVMGTLSKAVGSLGGFVTGDERLIDFLRQRARSFIYTTASPPAACAAAVAGLRIIAGEPRLRQRLWQNTNYLKAGLRKLGFDIMGSQTPGSLTPIIPIMLGDEASVMKASAYLFEHSILIPGIRPPTVPKGQCRLRISLMASHTQEDLDRLLDVLRGL